MAEEYSVEAQLSASDSGYTSTMKSASKATKDLGDSVKNATKSLKNSDSAIAGTQSKLNGLDSALKKGADSADKTATDLEKLKKETDSMGKSADNAADGLDKLTKGADSASDAVGDAADDLDKLKKPLGDLPDETEETSQGLEKLGNKSESAVKSIAKLAAGMLAAKAAAVGLSAIGNSMDSAVSRFDTMSKFPKVMQSLGFNADQSKASIEALADGIDGLPTKLDEVVSTTQQMTSITGDLDKSTQATLALNNAMLASGSSSADASRGMTQYLQMLSSGKVDLQSWKTLQETMPIGLQKTAEAMGFVGESAQRDLYTALQKGEVTFTQFQNKLIDLATGSGQLAELARTNSEGIATSFGNLGNAVSKGVANTITSLDGLSKEVTGKSIAQHFDSTKVIINTAFNGINKSIKSATPYIKELNSGIGKTIDVANRFSPAIIAVGAGFATWKTISAGVAYLAKVDTYMNLASKSGQTLTVVTNASAAATLKDMMAKQGHTAAEIADATATKTATSAMLAKNGAVTMSTMLIGVHSGAISKDAAATALMATITGTANTATKLQATFVGLATGAISIQTVATMAATAATTAFGVALKVAMGPIGWIIGGVGLLAGGIALLIKHMNKVSPEAEKMNKQNEKLVSSTKKLNDEIKKSATSRKDEQKEIDKSAEKYELMAQQVEQLSQKQVQTAADKKLLKDNITSLNESLDGLGLAYDEETGKLNMSTEALKKRISANKDLETASKAQKDLVEITRQQADVEKQLQQLRSKEDDWKQKLDEKKVSTAEYLEGMKNLGKEEEKLNETRKRLANEQVQTQETLKASSEAYNQAVADGVMDQITTYDNLKDHMKEVVDSMKETWQGYADHAGDMFDKLSDKQELSVAQMQENLDENQRILAQWSENIAALSTRGIDEGLLNKLRDMGPEGAGYVAALVNASDDELKRLSETFAKVPQAATDAFNKAFDPSKSGVNENIMAMVTQTKGTLEGAIQTAGFGETATKIPEQIAEGVQQGAEKAASQAEESGKKISEATKNGVEQAAPQAKEAGNKVGKQVGDGVAEGMKDGAKNATKGMEAISTKISQGAPEVKSEAKKVAKSIPEQFKGMDGKMNTIGGQIMTGLANGINAKSGAAIAAAQSVADKITATIKHAMDIRSPSRVTRRLGEFISLGLAGGIKGKGKEAEKAAKKVADAVTEALSDMKFEIDMGRLTQSNYRDMLKELMQKYTLNKQQYYQIMREYTQIDETRRTKLERVNESILQSSQTYADKMRQINSKLIDDIKKENEKFEQALKQREEALYNQTSLFERIDWKEALNPTDLLNNLKGQVSLFEDWKAAIDKLATKVPDKLLTELTNLGIKSTAEIEALTRLTDKQLDEYISLWEKKHKLSAEEASKQMEPARQEMLNNIQALNEQALKDFEQARKDWIKTLQGFSKDVKELQKEYKTSGYDIGHNFVMGVDEGLMEMEGALKARARELAMSTVNEMRRALDIHSPSRVTKAIGKFTGQGLVEGLDGMVNRTKKTANKLAQAAIPKVKQRDILKDLGSFDIRSTMDSVLSVESFGLGDVTQLLRQLLDKNQAIVLDTGQLVGATTSKYDSRLGNEARLKGRFS